MPIKSKHFRNRKKIYVDIAHMRIYNELIKQGGKYV